MRNYITVRITRGERERIGKVALGRMGALAAQFQAAQRKMGHDELWIKIECAPERNRRLFVQTARRKDHPIEMMQTRIEFIDDQ